jgi:nicotinamidase-related amidase
MSNEFRSCELADRHESALLVIDVQEKLVPAIDGHERLVWNIGRLISGAAEFGVPVWGTEQYPQGLGATVEPLKGRLGQVTEKSRFSCGQCEEMLTAFRDAGVSQLVLVGIESHVCVLQSALDLLALGFRVFVVDDAVSSRAPATHATAMRRMASAGVSITSTESILFEWCEDAADAKFKAISALIRDSM